MRATEFAELQVFELVAKHCSFAKAAEELGTSRSGVTQIIQNLEQRLGIRLLNRTTRSVSLTHPGQELLAQIIPALTALNTAVAQTQKYRDTPVGIVRVAASPLGARLYLEPMLTSFRETYPDITLDITIGHTEYHDCIAEGLDAAIGLENQINQDMIALKLGAIHFNLVASPSYIKNHGLPTTPYDLVNHKCIAVIVNGQADSQNWPFMRDGESFSITINRPMIVNDEIFALETAVNGAGILFCATEMSAQLVRNGQLQSLLDPWRIDGSNFMLYYPKRKHTSVAFQVVKEYLRSAAKSETASQEPSNRTRLHKIHAE
ncbi:MAG: bacterial regulatory helix-turn-helix, lysR family protein [Verrucomicrobiaceae bacterium]|nr:bacterial regulatory helix-turn-helix, lysR family protein [Verrucomicrobiaceae bacterium]